MRSAATGSRNAFTVGLGQNVATQPVPLRLGLRVAGLISLIGQLLRELLI